MERVEAKTVAHLGAALLASVGVLALLAMSVTALGSASPSVLGVGVAAVVGSAVLATVFVRAARGLVAARERDARRLADLEALVTAAGVLQAEDRKARIGDLVARSAADVLHGSTAAVWFGGSADRLVPAGCFTTEAGESCYDSGSGRLARDALGGSRVVSCEGRIAMPLVGNRGTVGVAVVACPGGCDIGDPFVAHIAQLFGSHAGLALERLEVIDELATLVVNDPLTGIGNRRHAATLLAGLRPGDAVVLIDIDGFKQINDRYGHVFGDRVLTELGSYLRDHLRGTDQVARYGGEEFLIVLSGVGRGARAAAKRVIEGWRAQDPPATFSVGFAVHRDGDTAEKTFEHADEALYRAKRAGRDRAAGFEFGRAVDVA